jgi:hypothetical protein
VPLAATWPWRGRDTASSVGATDSEAQPSGAQCSPGLSVLLARGGRLDFFLFVNHSPKFSSLILNESSRFNLLEIHTTRLPREESKPVV